MAHVLFVVFCLFDLGFFYVSFLNFCFVFHSAFRAHRRVQAGSAAWKARPNPEGLVTAKGCCVILSYFLSSVAEKENTFLDVYRFYAMQIHQTDGKWSHVDMVFRNILVNTNADGGVFFFWFLNSRWFLWNTVNISINHSFQWQHSRFIFFLLWLLEKHYA